MKAIIAGTGIDLDPRFNENMKTENTRYGEATYSICDEILYLPRHLPGHRIAPHRINYRANIELLRMLGVDGVISIYAVGSITRRLPPSSFSLVRDFIDLTWGRENTFFDEDARHTPMINPFDSTLKARFVAETLKMGLPVGYEPVYVTTQGPRLETAAEIEAYRRMGADIVGMTLATEAELLKEAGIPNAAVAYSINWAAGLDMEGVSFLEDESIRRIASTIMKVAVSALSEGE